MSPFSRRVPVRGFIGDLEDVAEDNVDYRRVLYTGAFLQLVVMSLAPGEQIGMEVHPDTDQFFHIEDGEGLVEIDGVRTPIKGDDAVLAPAGARHNIVNTGNEPLKLYTLYGPSHHRDGVVHRTREQAMADVEAFDGATTE